MYVVCPDCVSWFRRSDDNNPESGIKPFDFFVSTLTKNDFPCTMKLEDQENGTRHLRVSERVDTSSSTLLSSLDPYLNYEVYPANTKCVYQCSARLLHGLLA